MDYSNSDTCPSGHGDILAQAITTSLYRPDQNRHNLPNRPGERVPQPSANFREPSPYIPTPNSVYPVQGHTQSAYNYLQPPPAHQNTATLNNQGLPLLFANPQYFATNSSAEVAGLNACFTHFGNNNSLLSHYGGKAN